MKLKFLFFFLALLLTAVWTILLVLTLKERGALFYIGEGVITFSLVFLVYFYRKVVKPLDIIGNGMELLREQDFSSRLTPVGLFFGRGSQRPIAVRVGFPFGRRNRTYSQRYY